MARSHGSTRDRVLGGVSALVYGFLYVPIVVLVALSFNETGRPSS